MAKKKHEIMSLSMDPDMVEMLNTVSKKMGWNRSELIRKLVKKHLDLLVNEDEKIPVIIRVPQELRGDEEALRKWLNQKVDGITAALCKNSVGLSA
jgi:Arc/MetJ-type ribon-helix-helix transcriptional regulator